MSAPDDPCVPVGRAGYGEQFDADRDLSARFRVPARALADNDRSPLYAALMMAAADDLERDGVVAELFAGVPVPPGSVPQLRLLAALRELVLIGGAPDLATARRARALPPSTSADQNAGMSWPFRFGNWAFLGWDAGTPQPNSAADGCQGSPVRARRPARAEGLILTAGDGDGCENRLGMFSPVELPAGTVTFLFTDIEGSTRLLKRLRDGYGDVLAQHQSAIRAAFERHRGQEFGTEGDALFFAFRRARDAVAAAIGGQLSLAGERWPAGVEVRVRMGLHTGEPRVEHGGYVGLVLHRAARISSAAHGGQVLLSSTTRELVADDLPDGIGLRDLGEHRLKDLDRKERIYELRWPGATAAFPPVATLAIQVTTVASPASSLGIVGRDQELAVIESVLAAAGSGAGGLVLVEGPAGIGKTTLLRASRERAAERGMTVLHARATELERDYPMGVVRQCLEAVIRQERDHDRLLRGAAALAAPVLLAVGDVPETTPQALLHGLYWMVANLSAESPVLLAIDDAQWADAASLRFLAYLARRLEDNAVAVLIGVRNDEEPGNGGAAALAEIRVAGAGRRVDLRPLDVDEVSRLLGDLSVGSVAPAFARACHEATGGNPFLLGELVRALTADGVAFTAAGAACVTDVTPPSVARATAARLARLGEPAVVLARAAAVLGGGVSLEQTARLAGLSAAAAAAAAVALERAGIFDDDILLEFRHPILAGAVRAGLPARERAAGHGRAVALLREQGAPPDRIGVHLLHASAAGDAQTVTDLRRPPSTRRCAEPRRRP